MMHKHTHFRGKPGLRGPFSRGCWWLRKLLNSVRILSLFEHISHQCKKRFSTHSTKTRRTAWENDDGANIRLICEMWWPMDHHQLPCMFAILFLISYYCASLWHDPTTPDKRATRDNPICLTSVPHQSWMMARLSASFSCRLNAPSHSGSNSMCWPVWRVTASMPYNIWSHRCFTSPGINIKYIWPWLTKWVLTSWTWFQVR